VKVGQGHQRGAFVDGHRILQAQPETADESADESGAAASQGWAYLNALADAILVIDPEYAIRFANLAAENLLGASRTAMSSQRTNARASSLLDRPGFAAKIWSP